MYLTRSPLLLSELVFQATYMHVYLCIISLNTLLSYLSLTHTNCQSSYQQLQRYHIQCTPPGTENQTARHSLNELTKCYQHSPYFPFLQKKIDPGQSTIYYGLDCAFRQISEQRLMCKLPHFRNSTEKCWALETLHSHTIPFLLTP